MSNQSNIDLDAPATTMAHGEIILKKPFLKKLYIEWYQQFSELAKTLPEGKLLEIGSGGGFIKEINPNVLTTDILELPNVDIVMSAEDIPLEDNSVSGIFMINVLHHIKNSDAFLKEAQRVLKKGGKIFMVEPANTLWSRFFYRNFHHEGFDPSEKDWKVEGEGPLSDANGAIPWIIFKRDLHKFQQKYPDLVLEKRKDHTPMRYTLTGGLSFPSVVPGWSFKIVTFLENVFSFLFRYFGMFQTIIVKKK
ncbi:MAG: class I SAM-dependent methyltransferase [Chitinophagales bacterium]